MCNYTDLEKRTNSGKRQSMRKGQAEILKKAKELVLDENIKYLQDETKTLRELNTLFGLLSSIDFQISEDLLNTLKDCRFYGAITKDLDKGKKDKLSVYQKMTGKRWDYVKNIDLDFDFLRQIDDISDTKRVKHFIDLLDEYKEKHSNYYPKVSINPPVKLLADVFNKTSIYPNYNTDLTKAILMSNPAYKFYEEFNKKYDGQIWDYDKEVERAIKENLNLPYPILIQAPNSTIHMKTWNDTVQIKKSFFSALHSSLNGKNNISPAKLNTNSAIEIIAYPDSLYEVYKKRVIPLTLKKAKKYADEDEILKGFIQAWLDNRPEYIAKDIKNLPELPISFSEVLKYKSVRELMNAHYKDGNKINWNRVDIEKGYWVLKSLNKVTTPNILLDMLYKDELELPDKDAFGVLSRRRIDAQIADFLSNVLVKRTGVDKNIAFDYVECTKKINLSYSARRIMEEHDRNMDIYEMQWNKVKIPKNSVFKRLKLPSEFKWINTTRKLLNEGNKMHHCVATYSTRINNDKCGIYHLEKDGTPWTIEIITNKGEFKVNQIQTIGNKSVDKKEITKYVENVVKKAQKSR